MMLVYTFWPYYALSLQSDIEPRLGNKHVLKDSCLGARHILFSIHQVSSLHLGGFPFLLKLMLFHYSLRIQPDNKHY